MHTRSLPGSVARSASSILRRSSLSFGLLTVAAGALLVACNGPADESDLGEDASPPSSMLPNSPPPESAGQRPEKFPANCPSADDILAALDCPDCAVLNVGRVSLPMQGRNACTAKIVDESGVGSLFTTLDDGSVADEAALLEEERALFHARFGALTPELAAALDSLDSDDAIPVWIWARLTLEYPDKEAMIASPELGRRFAEEARDKAIAARAPIHAEIVRRGFRLLDDGGSTPMLRAVLPVHAIREMARMPEVVALGSDESPGHPLSTVYFTSDAAAAAQGMSTGSGRGVCLIEAGRPDNTSQLEIAGTASPNGATSSHIRMTSGLVRNTGTTDLAPAANVFIGNWDQYSATPTAPTVHEWCTSMGATTINFSWSFTDGSPGGLTGVDMQEDYFTKLWPFPLYVPAAGNAGCASGYDTVQNRAHNALVVGGSDDKGTTSFYDDTIYNCSSWRNPTSVHNDRELPYMVAPAVNIDSAGLTDTGTSFAAPQVAGTMALVEARNNSFGSWPEMKRALMLATSFRNVDGGTPVNLPAGDLKDGAGLLHSAEAVTLADPANLRYPGNTPAWNGYGNATLNFTTDFTNGVSNAKWNMQALSWGNHLRVAIAWDGSATCSASGLTCSADTLDADLDLTIVDTTTGAIVCSSSSFDSSWEMCDFMTTANHQYRAEIRKYATTAASTYLGIAWNVYN